MSSTSEPALRAARSTFRVPPWMPEAARSASRSAVRNRCRCFLSHPQRHGRPLDLLHVTLDASGVNFSIDNDGTIEVRHALTPSFSVQILSAPDPAQGPPPAVPAAPPCPARAAFPLWSAVPSRGGFRKLIIRWKVVSSWRSRNSIRNFHQCIFTV